MIYTIAKSIIAGIFVLFTNVNTISACSCKAQAELSVMNINDTELIFTATLLEYRIGMAAGSLKLKPKYVYKGELAETITIYFKLQESHTLFSKATKFHEQKDWIIFARKKIVGNKEYYRLMDSEVSSFCALSRPIIEKPKSDQYLDYLSEMGRQTDGEKQFFYDGNILEAEGQFKNNAPIERWSYYKSSGQLNISGNYKNGKRDGEWTKYTSNSKGNNIEIQKRFYTYGELKEIHDLKYSGAVTFKKFLSDTAEIRHYLYEDGSINSITHRNKDDDTMNTISYHKNGAIREKKYFKGDKLMYKYQYDEYEQKINEWIREN